MFIREDIEQEFASILSLMPQGDSKTTIEKLADKYRAGTVTSEDLVPAALVYDLLGENARVMHDNALVVETRGWHEGSGCWRCGSHLMAARKYH